MPNFGAAKTKNARILFVESQQNSIVGGSVNIKKIDE